MYLFIYIYNPFKSFQLLEDLGILKDYRITYEKRMNEVKRSATMKVSDNSSDNFVVLQDISCGIFSWSHEQVKEEHVERLSTLRVNEYE